MWNYKEAQSNSIAETIKQKLKESVAVQKIFEQFEVSPDRLDNLQITIVPLEKKYAETDGEVMKINEDLFKDGDFMEKHFFIIAHEIVHWLSRVKEAEAYMNDPEETLGFVMSVAYEIEQGTHPDEIWNKIYPKVEFHFHDEEDARQFFHNLTEKAMKILH